MAFKFKSVFKSAKPVEDTEFPKPPSGRQMAEDIEHLSGDDPLVIFADLLRSRARNTGSGNTHAFSSTFATKKGDPSSPIKLPNSSTDSLSHELASAALKDARSKIKTPSTVSSALIGPKSPSSAAQESAENAETFHRKLKQMRVASHKTDELIAYVISKLKDLDTECTEFIESIDNDTDSGNEDNEHERDLT